MRYPDECVRHKILDMVGDLALLATRIVGNVVAHRSGHQLNAALVRQLNETIERPRTARESFPASTLMIEDIIKVLPHRYPFLLIDRVLEYEAGHRVLALKNVSYNEPFFQGHWPGRPIMPGVLIIEALAQTAGIMLAELVDRSGRMALIVAVNHVKLADPLSPATSSSWNRPASGSKTGRPTCKAWRASTITLPPKPRFNLCSLITSTPLDHSAPDVPPKPRRRQGRRR